VPRFDAPVDGSGNIILDVPSTTLEEAAEYTTVVDQTMRGSWLRRADFTVPSAGTYRWTMTNAASKALSGKMIRLWPSTVSRVPTPTISPSGPGIYRDTLVTIVPGTSGTVDWYTDDGTDPRVSPTRRQYTDTFLLSSGGQTITAFSEKPDMRNSELATVGYVVSQSTVMAHDVFRAVSSDMVKTLVDEVNMST